MEEYIDKALCLSEAIKLTTSYAQGGYDKMKPDEVLDSLYQKLKQLYADAYAKQ